MKKNGFTLVELLVVIAIIAILSVIIVPSVIKVNQTINERMYKQKKDNIVSAAELYASDNPDIFNGAESVYIYVHQLIDANYIDTDVKYGEGNCNSKVDQNGTDPTQVNGCVINPTAKDVMNGDKILVVKKTAGVSGTYMGNEEDSSSSYANNIRLVDAVCQKFNKGEFIGKYGTGEDEFCGCKYSNGKYTDIAKRDKETGDLGPTLGAGSMCLIVSQSDSGNVDNWLKYGSSTANWRVLGVYQIGDTLYAKMITNDVIE